jgi:two-component system, NtrC family, response regulator HydG
MSTILVIEDNETLREGVVQVLKRMGHEVLAASNGLDGLTLFEAHQPELVITDLKMDGLDGMEVLQRILARDEDTLVMIITAFGSIEKAVEAMQKGAFDFIPKPFPPDLLRTKVEKALAVGKARRRTEILERENELLKKEVARPIDLEIVGRSAGMAKIFAMIDKLAPTDSTVYVYGESGTGKELIARAIHQASHRAAGPFVKVNCSALAESLLESELFGHEKGAFTGAIKRRLGRFELADGGTLFLDEIGDISPAIQLKLLRVLQEREFERVGGERTVKVDVRVVTATNKDLKDEVAAGRFREDLFYRLHIIPIVLPPLRERPEDIAALIDSFIARLGARTRSKVRGVDAQAMEVLKRHAWPGNVRELENVIEHALVFAEGELIGLADLPAQLRGQPTGNLLSLPEGECNLPDILEELERQLILRAYTQAQGVKTETARLLGIKPSALYYKLEKYGIGEAETEESG